MGVKLMFMLVGLCLIADALRIHGSADYASSPVASPPRGSRKRGGELLHGSPNKDSDSPRAVAPSRSWIAPSISKRLSKRRDHFSAQAPTVMFNKHHRASSRITDSPSESPVYPPESYHSRVHSGRGWHSLAPAPSPVILSNHLNEPSLPPAIAPSDPTVKKSTPPSPILALPPPPPNEDCASITCTDPLTYSPSGSPCGCVWPIQIELRLGVSLYTFFPLVSELAKEIAASISFNHSQVRIMGADSVSQQQLEKTTVLINLVPQGVKFKDSVALGIYGKFWHKQVLMKESLFGNYEVLYVHYPGLPPSPPSATSTIPATGSQPYEGEDSNGQAIKPLGVDVPKRKNHGGLHRSMIAVIVLLSFVALAACMVVTRMLVMKYKARAHHSKDPYSYSPAKPSAGATRSAADRSLPSSASVSFRSTSMAYMGAAKIFGLNDMERATNNFDSSMVLGEGGFGIVYSGKLDGGLEVAVKVLKREDQHGSREFLAEVEMLSRLHHRNLVTLIGICTDERVRCLVYELIPNGSVESHLHGRDKEKCPLDWGSRMKIALGAARGLAYLHEDSYPRVIHRDFKSSNILLEHDFTPKLSDFGLARAAQDEGNKQISTHVMGTFGYLAPEYAMTGHLLVKSDVYSYGVVLLELLTGRKPVDLSQPPGQENLVTWARPLLTSKEGLETIVDPSIKSDDISFDSLAKVAAIASMCVQPEASHRPFMGEVVQALKLVCSEFDETKETGDTSFRQLIADSSNNADSSTKLADKDSGEIFKGGSLLNNHVPAYDSDPETRVRWPGLDVSSGKAGIQDEEFWSFSRQCRSGPLGIGKRRKFWQRLKSLSRGSTSEHEFSLKFWPESY